MKDFKDLGFHCGVDEVGRGAWSGPVVAAAVRFDKSHKIRGLADSKTLSPRQRIKLYFEILETFSVGVSLTCLGSSFFSVGVTLAEPFSDTEPNKAPTSTVEPSCHLVN